MSQYVDSKETTAACRKHKNIAATQSEIKLKICEMLRAFFNNLQGVDDKMSITVTFLL